MLDVIAPARSERMDLAEAYFGAGDPLAGLLAGFTTFSVGGQTYTVPVQTTMPGQKAEAIANSFEGFVLGALTANSVIFGLASVRLRVFSEARFQFQRFNSGRPGDLYGSNLLALLEEPWPGGTTGDLLAVMLLHADFSGNCYLARVNGQLVAMRPDWVEIMLGDRHYVDADGRSGTVGKKKLGYLYYQGGKQTGVAPVSFLADEVAHFAPQPDPLAWYRGMSWLTPVVREIRADSAATGHKLKFFENAATANLAVKLDISDAEQFTQFVDKMDEGHKGWQNAYKCVMPDTPIQMADGRLCRADSVRVGDHVLSWDGERYLPARAVVAALQPPAPVYEITTNRQRVIRVTGNHPFLSSGRRRRRANRPDDPFDWVAAKDLRVGDRLKVALGWKEDDPESDPLDPYTAWVLGAWVGDGTYNGVFSQEPANGVLDRLSIGYDPVHKANFDYYVRGIRALLGEHGLLAVTGHTKRVPAAIVTGSRKTQAMFLAGYLDTDGHVTDPAIRVSGGVGWSSCNRGLLEQCQSMLAGLGVNSTVSVVASHRVRTSERVGSAFRLSVFGNTQIAELAGLFDLAHVEKARRLAAYAAAADERFDRRTIERVDTIVMLPDAETIGLEIEGTHTHITAGLVTHNTLYLGAGADVTVIGANMREMDFKATQGAGETRLAAAAGVPPVIAGLSEGLQGSSLNAGNFGQARRQFADMTLLPLWRNASGSLQSLVGTPDAGSRLWYDTRDIAFLREDQKDSAQIQQLESFTIRELVIAGFEPSSIIAAVTNNDWSLLNHTGLFSIQLQEPGINNPKLPAATDLPPPAPDTSHGTAGRNGQRARKLSLVKTVERDELGQVSRVIEELQ